MTLSKSPVKGKKKFARSPIVGSIGQLAYGFDGSTLVLVLVGLGGKAQ